MNLYDEQQQARAIQQRLKDLELLWAQNRASASLADAEMEAAARILRAVQMRQNASTARDYLAAQIESIVARAPDSVGEAEATRKFYDAKDRALAFGQQRDRLMLEFRQKVELLPLRMKAVQLQVAVIEELEKLVQLRCKRGRS